MLEGKRLGSVKVENENGGFYVNISMLLLTVIVPIWLERVKREFSPSDILCYTATYIPRSVYSTVEEVRLHSTVPHYLSHSAYHK